MTGISSFLGKLFGTEKALTAMVEATANGLDKLVHTGEEKSDAAAADRTEARAMIIEWMKATQGQNLARRVLALAIAFVWLSQYVAAQIMQVASVWASAPDKWLASAKALSDDAGAMSSAVMLILAFYFAAPHMGDIVKAVSGKFTRSVNGG